MVKILQPGYFGSEFSKELDTEEAIKLFDRVDNKVISNVDTLYYSINVGDWKSPEVLNLIDYLEKKNKDVVGKEFIKLDDLGIEKPLIMQGIGFNIYRYDISIDDFFTAFIAHKVPNNDTPQIFIQIRSQHLWLNGDIKSYEESKEIIELILDKFGIKVKQVKFNRIDIANHTNIIQNPLKFFREDKLGEMQVSRFKRWSKQGNIKGEKVECDYITFGRRKSNNVFLRIYEKNQEIINQGYKQFFLELWRNERMISEYDRWVIEKTFVYGSVNYIDTARLEFYLMYGKNKDIKKEIAILMSDKYKKIEDIEKLADRLTPRVTIILNIEFQVKRKFINTMEFQNDVREYEEKTKDLEQLLFNKRILHNILTDDVIRFVNYNKTATRKRNKPTANWWKKIQNTYIDDSNKESNVKVFRNYQKSLDMERIKKLTVSRIASYSIYTKNNNEDSITQDLTRFLTDMNENDLKYFMNKKKEKAYLLKNRLAGIEDYEYNNLRYLIIDSETGEFLA